VICFQETKREDFDIVFIRNFCPRNFDSYAFNPSVGQSGGTLAIWDILAQFSLGTALE
jgi:hypothetical protein